MPQMKPTKWTFITLLSSMTMMMMISSVYFTHTHLPLLSPVTPPPNNPMWSWKW